MDTDPLSRLSTQQISSLSDEQKAIFCSLDDSDQVFFSETFTPNDLPVVLDRKGEILKRNKADRERLLAIQEQMVQNTAAASPGSQSAGDVITAVAGVVGVGVAAAVVATDNKASWRGVKPGDLIPALRNEFNTERTQLSFSGSPSALAAAIMLLADTGFVPALTINLTAVDDGTEVKMSDLTSQGTIATIKEGGAQILNMAGNAIRVLRRGRRGSVSPEEVLSTASQTLSSGADLAKVAGNMQLKERAWKVIKQTAEAVEANYLSELEKARQAREALEKAWDRFNNCPVCGVSFGSDDQECRVCGTDRPEKPLVADPRFPGVQTV